MREIDTGALQQVSRSLGVGNPASVRAPVVFDDGNLQQVLDVSKFMKQRAVQGVFSLSFTGAGNSITRASHTFANLFQDQTGTDYVPDLITAGLHEPPQVDVWITWVQLLADDTAISNLDEFVLGTRRPGGLNSTLLARAVGSQQGAPLDATDQFITLVDQGADERPRLPYRLPRLNSNDALNAVADCNAGGSCEVLAQVGLHFQLRDTPLWYAV